MKDFQISIAEGEITGRIALVDFVRGLAIIDMILVHYAGYFPELARKLIVYHDCAVELFVMTAGFVVGRISFPFFLKDARSCSAKLLKRALVLLCIQYFLVIAISVPTFALTAGELRWEACLEFLVESIFMVNQVGIIHILPTFIPLLVVSPLMLFMMAKNLDLALILASFFIFMAGQINPYLFSYGEPPIFPVMIWQIYYVFGSALGKADYHGKGIRFWGGWWSVSIATGFFAIVMLFKHSTSLCMEVHDFMQSRGIEIKRFPLNIYGLLYGSTIVYFIWAWSGKLWPLIARMAVIRAIIGFGQRSLSLFVIHTVFAKGIAVKNVVFHFDGWSTYVAIAANLIVSYASVVVRQRSRGNVAPRT